MNTRALHTLAAAVVFCATVAHAGGQVDARAPQIVIVSSSGEITFLSLAGGDDARVIVELEGPGHGAVLAARQETMSRFRGDLASLAAVAQADDTSSPPSITREFSRGFFGAAVSLPRHMIAEIEALPWVRRVHRDVRVRAAAIEPGVSAVGAPEVWSALGAKGSGIRVAIIDTGIDQLHPDWTPSMVKSALVSTARPVTGSVLEQGSGHLDALRAASATPFLAPSSVGAAKNAAPVHGGKIGIRFAAECEARSCCPASVPRHARHTRPDPSLRSG